MITCKELRIRAWNSLRDRYWNALVALLIVGVISGIGSSASGAQSVFSMLSLQFAERIPLTAVILSVVSIAISLVSLVLTFLIIFPLSIGSARYFIRNTYEKPDVSDVFFGFKSHYMNNVKIMFLVSLKTVLWTLFFIVPGIIKAYEYAMIPYILAENPGISSKEAFHRSKLLMNGHKWHLFVFELSYIGWALVGMAVCCGIGTFFVAPYFNAGMAEFYKEISEDRF